MSLHSSLLFAFCPINLILFSGLPWFKKILNLTLPEPRDININPKNCIGTVLSLNGHRRYFCMYHAKHPEGSRKRVYTANNGSVAGKILPLFANYGHVPRKAPRGIKEEGLHCQQWLSGR